MYNSLVYAHTSDGNVDVSFARTVSYSL